MDSRSAIVMTLQTSMVILKSYISDFTAEELLSRPGDGCNHLAWQLGHLVASQAALLDSIAPGAAPALPEGFAEHHDTQHATSQDASRFHSAAEYLALFDQVNDALIASLNKFSDTELDAPSPERFQSMFPTIGHMFVLMATHPMMHAGQFVPVRRKLGKPIVI